MFEKQNHVVSTHRFAHICSVDDNTCSGSVYLLLAHQVYAQEVLSIYWKVTKGKLTRLLGLTVTFSTGTHGESGTKYLLMKM